MSEQKKPEAQPGVNSDKEKKSEVSSVEGKELDAKAIQDEAKDKAVQAAPDAAKPSPAEATAHADGVAPELAEAAAEVGKLPPEAQASKTPLSAKTQASVDAAAVKQAASPAARTTSEPSDAPAAELQGPSDAEKEAKAKAAAEARAARANARAGKAPEEDANAVPKEPSPNQPLLDRVVQIIKESVGEEAVEQAFINEMDDHLPVVVIKNDVWAQTAQLFKEHDELQCNYLRNLSGVDQEKYLEVVYHLLSLSNKRDYCVKVKTDREQPSIPSVTSIWPTANWNEREAYDLFGIHFSDHPDLRRIMLPDEWVGHPLRKDYEPLDPEV